MNTNMETIKEYLTAEGWQFREVERGDDEAAFIRMGMQGENGEWEIVVDVKEKQEMALCYSIVPVKVPANRRADMSEFISRANYGMIIGNFEIDMTDGEVRFKTSVMTRRAPLTTDSTRNILYPNVLMMDKYFKGIMAVAFTGANPQDACAECEKGMHQIN